MYMMLAGLFIGVGVGWCSAIIGVCILREDQRRHGMFDYDEIVRIIRANPSLFETIVRVKYNQDNQGG